MSVSVSVVMELDFGNLSEKERWVCERRVRSRRIREIGEMSLRVGDAIDDGEVCRD